MDKLAVFDRVPPAISLPPGSIVLSLNGTERDELVRACWVWGGAVFVVGIGTGYLISRLMAPKARPNGKRRGRR